MGFLADKRMRLWANIHTTDCAGLTVALPRKPPDPYKAGSWACVTGKPQSGSLSQSTTGNNGNEKKAGRRGRGRQGGKGTDTGCQTKHEPPAAAANPSSGPQS